MRSTLIIVATSLLLTSCAWFEKSSPPGGRIDQSGTLKINPDLVKEGSKPATANSGEAAAR